MSDHRILVVDDEPKVALFFQKHLELIGEGYSVRAVNSGQEALVALNRDTFDLMITDLRMPRMNGLELLKQARQVSPQTKTILVTAYGSTDVWQQAEKLNAFRSLSKPLKIPELLTAVRAALSQPDRSETSELLVLSGEHIEGLEKHIERLRVDTGARVVILADISGYIYAVSGSLERFEARTAIALLGSTMAASTELTRQFKYPRSVHFSYFEGPPYDLYAANVSSNLFLMLVYERVEGASRIGLVWLYARRALDDISNTLSQQPVLDRSPSLSADFAESVKGELDSLLFGESERVDRPGVEEDSKTVNKDSSKQAGLIRKIEQIIKEFRKRTGLSVGCDLTKLNVPVQEEVAQLILNTIAEGLKNAYLNRNASAIVILFNQDGRTLTGTLIDNGASGESTPSKEWLARLRQLYEPVGGELSERIRPDKRTILEFRVPIDE